MINKKLKVLLNFCAVILVAGIGVIATSCNAKDDEPEEIKDYITSESVAVTAFSLAPDIRIMKNLDSVFFSIDLEHGVIFNADSLPKGTNITKLVPKISYPASVTSAVIEMTGGEHREGTSNYYTNANDTIDFTGDVTLTLATSNNAISKTYKIKVNVHMEDPDTLYWDRMGTMELPSRRPGAKSQKSVAYNEGVFSLIEEADGTWTIAKTSDIFAGNWTKQQLVPGFTPNISTLTAGADDALYLLDDQGNLYNSTTGADWTKIASGWQNIIGLYGETILGLSLNGETLTMTSWPENAYPAIEMPAEFPLSGYTAPIEYTNRWTPDPTIIIFGGYPYPASGKSYSWAFDGTQWVNVAENALPALTGMGVVNYYSYLKSATNSLLKEFEVYLAFGGKDPNGNINDTVFVSYDHGINWQKAQNYMQLPAGISSGYMVDAISMSTVMDGNLSDRWNLQSKRRLPFEIDGNMILWECPYIFLFGGYDKDMTLNGRIRSGVLQRLTFVPLF